MRFEALQDKNNLYAVMWKYINNDGNCGYFTLLLNGNPLINLFVA